MKVYFYYLKGTQVNSQFGCKPKYYVNKLMTYAYVLRVWRFQISVRWSTPLNLNK